LDEASEDLGPRVDVLNLLRIQFERQATRPFPSRNSSLIRSKISTLASTETPIVSTKPAMEDWELPWPANCARI